MTREGHLVVGQTTGWVIQWIMRMKKAPDRLPSPLPSGEMNPRQRPPEALRCPDTRRTSHGKDTADQGHARGYGATRLEAPRGAGAHHVAAGAHGAPRCHGLAGKRQLSLPAGWP